MASSLSLIVLSDRLNVEKNVLLKLLKLSIKVSLLVLEKFVVLSLESILKENESSSFVIFLVGGMYWFGYDWVSTEYDDASDIQVMLCFIKSCF